MGFGVWCVSAPTKTNTKHQTPNPNEELRAFPIRHLPVVQNWDCHVCGSCCKEYVVRLTDEERKRIEAQGWEKDPEFAGQPIFFKSGMLWARRYNLNHRADGSCVFLSEQ